VAFPFRGKPTKAIEFIWGGLMQLELNLGLSPQIQIEHRGWKSLFRLESDEWIYQLLDPQGHHYAECYTDSSDFDLAKKWAKENIDLQFASAPFVMSPQTSKNRSDYRGAASEKTLDIQQFSSLPESIPLIDTAKPFLKWLGSKRWAVNKVKQMYLPHRHRRLVDLTVGSGALPLAIQPNQVLACDVNPQLINLWRWVQQNGKFTIALRSEEVYFYEQRELYNYLVLNQPCHPDIPQLLYLLCRTSFNGLHRSSIKSPFNAPWGKYSKFGGHTDLSGYRESVKDWHFESGDFRETIRLVKDNDFVVFDPPYDSVDGKAFTGYSGAFGRHEQIAAARVLSALKVPVVTFNADTPFIRSLYGSFGWVIEEVEVARSISCKGDRTKAHELIMTRNI